MSYRKGLQCLMMAVVLVGIGVLSAGCTDQQHWKPYNNIGLLYAIKPGIMLTPSGLHVRRWR